MPREIERRFLVSGFSRSNKFPLHSPRHNIKQGYLELAGSINTCRVRIIDDKRPVMTIKEGKGIDREELESGVDSLDFSVRLMKLCPHKIEKTRFEVGRWEVDFFKPPLDGLILAEIELATADEAFEMPEWIGEAIEVTDSITNHHLARLATELRGSGAPALPYLFSHIFSKVFKVVLTGGPCSGKSTIMKEIHKTMPDVHCMPEVATIVIDQLNIKPKMHFGRTFQRLIYDTQRLFDATTMQYALLEGKSGIVFDRGPVCGAVYMPGGIPEFEQMLGTRIEDEYKKIDLVICLDTPPREIYEANKDNNPARFESYDEARALSEKTRMVWQGHPNFVFIGNEDGWEAKVRGVKEAIRKVLG